MTPDMRIRVALAGYVLPCGCVVGVYEAYDGRIVEIVDARDSACREHAAGRRLPPRS